MWGELCPIPLAWLDRSEDKGQSEDKARQQPPLMAFGLSTAVHMDSGLSWHMSCTEFAFVTFVNESVSPGRCVGVTCVCIHVYIPLDCFSEEH